MLPQLPLGKRELLGDAGHFRVKLRGSGRGPGQGSGTPGESAPGSLRDAGTLRCGSGVAEPLPDDPAQSYALPGDACRYAIAHQPSGDVNHDRSTAAIE
jgi:hypothetical protein